MLAINLEIIVVNYCMHVKLQPTALILLTAFVYVLRTSFTNAYVSDTLNMNKVDCSKMLSDPEIAHK